MELNGNYIVVTLDEMEKEVKDILAIAKDKNFNVFIKENDQEGFVLISHREYKNINMRIQDEALKKACELIEEYKKTFEHIHDDFI